LPQEECVRDVVRVADDDAAAGDRCDGAVEACHMIGIRREPRVEATTKGARRQPRGMSIPRDTILEADALVDVERVPAPERGAPHLRPERALADGSATTAEVVVPQASLPQVAEAADRHESRQLSKEQGEDRAARAAGSADVRDVRGRG